jgi:uncharacterized linocin/CFP29 family protein
MDILRKSLAPITKEAWDEINDQAKLTFKNILTARKFVDIDGPKGLEYGAVSLGRLSQKTIKQNNGVNYGISQVLPLIEIRKPFHLDLWELDNVSRGVEDVDLEPLEDAARDFAKFEDEAMYYGFNESGIKGMKESSGYDASSFPDTAKDLLKTLGKVITQFQSNAVEGPYSMVVSPDKWHFILSQIESYPLINQIKSMLGGNVIQSPNVKEAFIISERGGDFKLTVGQDISIGFDSATTTEVKLYYTESFTFQVLEPNAVAVLV